MERALETERLYSVGQYNNIRFSDEISKIPEELVLDQELIAKLRYLQIIQIELDFRNYLRLYKNLNPLTIDESINLLEELRVETLNLIKEHIKPIEFTVTLPTIISSGVN